MYNLTVDVAHTFFVGHGAWLVHNEGPCDDLPTQIHHYSTNKSRRWTSQFEDITSRYKLDLDASWNKEGLPHLGRHPNTYHEWVLEQMQLIDGIAKGDKDTFLDLFETHVKSVVRENPEMLRKSFWE